MAESAELSAVEISAARTPKDKSCLLEVMGRYWKACAVDRSQPVLVLGGDQEDIDILTAWGFERIVLSNLDAAGMALDAENVALADDSYPVVFAHAVLHHCRCPQKAVGEMVRVSRQHVFFVEPNDSRRWRHMNTCTAACETVPSPTISIAGQGMSWRNPSRPITRNGDFRFARIPNGIFT